jgi:hypothetical protein
MVELLERKGSELPVDQRSSYLRSRQIALKKFSPQGGTLAEAPKRAFLPDPALAGWRHWRHNHFIRRPIDICAAIITQGEIILLVTQLGSVGATERNAELGIVPAKPAASIQASSSDNSPGRRNGRSSSCATNPGSVKA